MDITISKSNKFWAVYYFFFAPVDTIRIKFFRVALGGSLLIYASFRWIYAKEWLTSTGFHISKECHSCPPMWMPVMPEAFLPWFGFTLFGGIVAFTCSWQTKWTDWVLLGCVVYMTFADLFAAYTLNLVFIISILTVALAGEPKGSTQSVWPVRILQAVFLLVIFMPGWSKAVHGEWLTNPYVLWTNMHGNYRTELGAFLLGALPIKAWAIMQYSALMFELLSPMLFMLRGLRWIGFVWGGGFQLMIAATLKHIVYFNLMLTSFFVLFVDEKQLRSFADKISKVLMGPRNLFVNGIKVM